MFIDCTPEILVCRLKSLHNIIVVIIFIKDIREAAYGIVQQIICPNLLTKRMIHFEMNSCQTPEETTNNVEPVLFRF